MKVSWPDTACAGQIRWRRKRKFLAVMFEFFDPDCPFAGITRGEAAELKKVVLALPANRISNLRPKVCRY